MVFSEQELICFNSLLDGKRIFGTRFSAPEKTDREYIDSTVSQLKVKGMLNEKDKPNEAFAAAVKVLEEYKAADKYLIINKSKIALKKDSKYVISLTDIGEALYQLAAVDKQLMLEELIKTNSFLAEQKSSDEEEIRTVNPMDWLQQIKQQPIEQLLCIQTVQQNKFGESIFLYNRGVQGFIYISDKESLTQCRALTMIQLLKRLFEMSIFEEAVK